MNSYEEKRAARIERLRDRADRLSRAGAARVEQATKMADVIPFGQPILVGHHSEGRDRRYREKIRNGFTKGYEMQKEAGKLAARADSAESNPAISSDDPDAVDKLEGKLAELEGKQALMIKFNRALRAGKTDEELAALTGLPVGACAELRKPDFCGRVGFADYELKNNGANIRRIKARGEHLERVAAALPKEPEEIGDVRIEETENRVRVFFPGKPSEGIRAMLKRNGFRWSPTVGAWQSYVTHWAWQVARNVASSLLLPEVKP